MGVSELNPRKEENIQGATSEVGVLLSPGRFASEELNMAAEIPLPALACTRSLIRAAAK